MHEVLEKYLPLASVVLLKNSKKKVMITGYAVETQEMENKLWDYVGCLWPEGMISQDKTLVFDHKDIVKVVAIGYFDEEQQRFFIGLNKAMELREESLKNKEQVKIENFNE